jgi:primosomal protein N' (replication factor Y)
VGPLEVKVRGLEIRPEELRARLRPPGPTPATLILSGGAGKAIAILGPAPAPLAKLRGEHRAQFFVKGGDRAAMRAAVRAALAASPALARRAVVDVDPVSML